MAPFKSLLYPLVTFVCVAGLLFSNCKKKEIQGPQGEPGTPGGGGNSNISTSETFTVAGSDWLVDSALFGRKVTLNFAGITKDVVEKGSVKMFMKLGTNWAELPYTQGDFVTQYGFDVGHIYLEFFNIEQIGMASPPATNQFRVVVLTQSQRPGTPDPSKNIVVNSFK